MPAARAAGRDAYGDGPPPITCGTGRIGCDGIGPEMRAAASFCADGRFTQPPRAINAAATTAAGSAARRYG